MRKSQRQNTKYEDGDEAEVVVEAVEETEAPAAVRTGAGAEAEYEDEEGDKQR